LNVDALKKNLITFNQNDLDRQDELFLIFVENFQNIEFMNIVNALVDNVFKHRLTSMNNVQFVILTSYTYNTIIEFRYDDTEFKRLLIDSEAITRSTEEINQLKVGWS
jgi:hypothetical protein